MGYKHRLLPLVDAVGEFGIKSILLISQQMGIAEREYITATKTFKEHKKLRGREDDFVFRCQEIQVKVTSIEATSIKALTAKEVKQYNLIVVAGELTYQSLGIASQIRKICPKVDIAIEFCETNYAANTAEKLYAQATRLRAIDLLPNLFYLTRKSQSPKVLTFDEPIPPEGLRFKAKSKTPSKTVKAHSPKPRIKQVYIYPDEIPESVDYIEGGVRKVSINAYERDRKARAACIAAHGYGCSVCQINFHQEYGEVGKGFIHVHHNRPIATRGGVYKVNPAADLIPVCPNCHAMLHSQNPPLTIEQLIAIRTKHARSDSRGA